MADDKSHASLGSHRTAGSKGSKGSRSTRSHGSSSRGSYADTGRPGSNFSTVAPFVIAKLKKKSAGLLFSCTADAEDLVLGVGDSCDKFTASIVPPPNAGSPK